MKAFALGSLFLGLLGALPLAAQPIEASTEATTCAPSATNLCLNDGRFTVTAAWRTATGTSGSGQAVVLTGDTGYFWFFDSSNVELAVKVLDACGVNTSFWVFASGLTDVGVTLTVTDMATGQSRQYTNPVGTAFVAIQDTQAFRTCSTPTTHVANLTGSWAAFLTVNGVGNAASLSMTQTGSSVSGTVSVFDGGGGFLTGSVNGDAFTFRVDEVSPCAGTFNGSGTVSANEFVIQGNGTGADCGGSYARDLVAAKTFSEGQPASGSADMTGSWNVTLTFAGSQYSAVLTLVQSGNNLAGTVAITGFGNGSVTGSIIGQKLVLTINELSPCLGFFTAVGTNATSSFVSGNIVGNDCDGGYQGTFTLTRR